MMKIYTRTGDEGITSVIGKRVPKDDLRIEAYGTVDELNAIVGQTISILQNEEKLLPLCEQLFQIQHMLFDCGSDLAYADPDKRSYKVSSSDVAALEQWIDVYEQQVPALTRFILPGGAQGAAMLHVCRTVCRRAERRVVTLAQSEAGEKATGVNVEVLRYLNRLSDYFFNAARWVNTTLGMEEVEYIRSAEVFRLKDK